jgi:hypothetical protein
MGESMRIYLFALAALAFTAAAADVQKTPSVATTKNQQESKRDDVIHLLAALGMPQANSEAAKKQILSASKDPKLASLPESYWKDYLAAAGPGTFEKILVPIFDKAYSHAEIKALLALYASPEFKKVQEKHPEGFRMITEKNPLLLRGKAYEAFSSHMTEVGKSLQQKHGIKAPEPKK